MVRQIQLVIWDESGLAVASAEVPLGVGVPDGRGAYESALQVAHQAELLLLYLANDGGDVRASDIPPPDPNQLVLF